eukprot:5989430-Prymnesium_polylepis.1
MCGPLWVLPQVTLALGNYLNGGTAKGAAWGFKLESLSKIVGTKTVDGKSTPPHEYATPLSCARPNVAPRSHAHALIWHPSLMRTP